MVGTLVNGAMHVAVGADLVSDVGDHPGATGVERTLARGSVRHGVGSWCANF